MRKTTSILIVGVFGLIALTAIQAGPFDRFNQSYDGEYQTPMERFRQTRQEAYQQPTEQAANEQNQYVDPIPSSSASSRITFIELNDLHANLMPHWEQVRTGGRMVKVGKRGGLARIATKIGQIRAANPKNTILMNIGDTYHGGAEGMFSNGNAIIKPVDALQIDVGVPGNWDFAYGPIVTNARYGNVQRSEVLRPNYTVLAANATFKTPDMVQGRPMMERMAKRMFNYQEGQAFLPPTTIIERQGIKIGFIGITSDIVERMHPMMAMNIAFTQGQRAYLDLIQRHAATLRSQGVNMVVVMSELGIHKDWNLANNLPRQTVDVFFSAHTHEATFNKRISRSGAIVVEAGNDTYLGEMNVDFRNGRPSNYQWTLHQIDQRIPEEPIMREIIAKARAPFVKPNPNIEIPTVTPGRIGLMGNMMQMSSQKLTRGLDEIVGYTQVPLERRNSLENNFNNVFTDLLREKTGADVAITPGFRFDSSVIPPKRTFNGYQGEHYWMAENNSVLDGEITVADIYRFIPAPYQLAQGQITGAGLRNIIEENINAVYSPTIFEQSGGWVDGFSGLQLDVDLSRPKGQRVISMRDKETNREIRANDVLQVAGCARPMDMNASETLCSYKGFKNVTNLTQANGKQSLAAADFLMDAIEKGKLNNDHIHVRKDIRDLNRTNLWPDLEFYQPLEGVR